MPILENYPSSISQITLKQWIEWQNMYGNSISQERAKASKIQNIDVQDLELLAIEAKEAVYSISFFSGVDFNDLSENYDIKQILSLFSSTQMVWNSEINNIESQFPDGTFIFEQKGYLVMGLTVPDPLTYEFIEMIKPDAERFIDFINGDWNSAVGVIASVLKETGNNQNQVPDIQQFENLTMDKFWYTITVLSQAFKAVFNNLRSDTNSLPINLG